MQHRGKTGVLIKGYIGMPDFIFRRIVIIINDADDIFISFNFGIKRVLGCQLPQPLANRNMRGRVWMLITEHKDFMIG